MKQKLRKIKILFLLTILSFVGCQPEEEVVEQNNYQNSFTIERISENEFKKKAPKAFGKMELLKQNSSNNTHQRTVNINNEFSVDTDEIVQITKENKVSYTLPIYRTIENGLVENLVLSLQNDNSFSAKIITYNLSQSEKELLQNGIFVDVNNKMQVQNLDNANSIASEIFARNSSDCFEVQTEYEMCCHNVHSTLDIQNGERCQCPNPPTGYTYTITAVTCEDDNGGGSNPVDSDPTDYTAPGDDTSYGGDGDGSTGSGTPNDEESTNNENEPVDNLGEEDLTLPIVKNPTPPTPCDELNKLTKNPNYPTHPFMDSNDKRIRTAIINMSDELSTSSEAGYAFYNQGNYPEYGPYANYTQPSGNNHVYFPNRTYQFGTIHTHPTVGHIPMFSHDDIYSLLSIAEYYNSGPLAVYNTSGNDLFVCIMVVEIGTSTYTYAIKIDDITKLQALNNIHPNGNGTDTTWDDFGENLKEYYVNRADGANGSPSQYEKTFLQFIQDQDLGVSLYEMEQTGFGTPNVQENWTKLELDGNDPPKEIPCN